MNSLLNDVVTGIFVAASSGIAGYLIRKRFFQEAPILPRIGEESYQHLDGKWNLYYVTRDKTVDPDPNCEVYLPLAGNCPGREYTIKNIRNTGTILVGTTGLDLIDVGRPYNLGPWQSIVVVSDGDADGDGEGHWYIVANYP